MTHNIDYPRVLLAGINPLVSTVLANLVLDPTVSLSPNFVPILVGGIVTFVISLGLFFEKKHGLKAGVWHIASIGLAGFVLVSWARYHSIFVSAIMEILIAASIAIALLFIRKAIATRYGRRGAILVYVGLFLAGLLPAITIIQNLGESPVLVVSPSSKFVQLSRAGMKQNITVSIASVYANAWDFRLTAEPNSTLLTAYLDSKEKGPVEIPFLERGRDSSLTLRIDTSPQILNGTYSIILNFTYKDSISKTYGDSTDVEVLMGEMMPTPSFALPTVYIGIGVIILCVFILYFLAERRKQSYR